MHFKLLHKLLLIVAVILPFTWWLNASGLSSVEVPTVPLKPTPEAALMCSWREPEADLRVFYPAATSHRASVAILSGAMLELKQRLGRWPTVDENPLYLHRVYHSEHLLGTVLARRVRGEYGVIEIVLAVNTDGTVQGLRLQRLREPEIIEKALRSPQWLRAFNGKTTHSDFQHGGDIPSVVPAARKSARAVVEGVRSLLILLDIANRSGHVSTPSHH